MIDLTKDCNYNLPYIDSLCTRIKVNGITSLLDPDFLDEVVYAKMYLDILVLKSSKGVLSDELDDCRIMLSNALDRFQVNDVILSKSKVDIDTLLSCFYEENNDEKKSYSFVSNKIKTYLLNNISYFVVMLFTFSTYFLIDLIPRNDKDIDKYLTFFVTIILLFLASGIVIDLFYIIFPSISNALSFNRVVFVNKEQGVMLSNYGMVEYKLTKDSSILKRNKEWLKCLIYLLEFYDYKLFNKVSDIETRLFLIESNNEESPLYYLEIARVEFMRDCFLGTFNINI